jgi:hypothetical protein
MTGGREAKMSGSWTLDQTGSPGVGFSMNQLPIVRMEDEDGREVLRITRF